jgi:putative ABC transport system ATP-binding protein
MIELRDIRKVFNAGKPHALTAVDGVNLSLDARAVTVFQGPSGSGKTTLLALVGCMTRPTEGRILQGDREITSLPERFLTDVRRTTFGFIFQQFNLVRGISVLENVMLPAYPLGEHHASLKKRARALLDLFGILPRESSKSEWLSGGEAQRNDPQIIIADEPTAHLDTKLSREFMDIVGRLKTEQKTVIIASHDPLVYGSPVVDRVITVRDGKIEAEGR